MNETVELTKEVVYEDIKNFLSETGEILKEGSIQGFDLMVKKAFWIDGVVLGAFSLLILILSCFFIYKLVKYFRKNFEDEKEENNEVLLWGIFILGIIVIACCIAIGKACTHIILPEYYAVEQIMELVK